MFQKKHFQFGQTPSEFFSLIEATQKNHIPHEKYLGCKAELINPVKTNKKDYNPLGKDSEREKNDKKIIERTTQGGFPVKKLATDQLNAYG